MRTKNHSISRSTRGCVTALSLAALAATVSCTSDSSPTVASVKPGANEAVGQLRINLTGSSQSGVTYRLREAILMVQGPDRTLFFDTEQNPDTEVFSEEVPGGDYTLFVQEGWALENVSSGERVTAVLMNPNPDQFRVLPGESTPVTLLFRVGDDVVSTAPGSFEIGISVDDEAGPKEFCSSDAECAPGAVCCIAGFLGNCYTLDPGAACPLPDLTMLGDAAASSIIINRETFPADSCSVVEGCVNGPGERRLMRFDTVTPNLGEADLVMGDPATTPGYELSECHGHNHFEGYANYELVDAAGAIVAAGHKQAFCLMDLAPFSPDAGPRRFHCGFQGISRGWADIYSSGLDCQWVDITDVAPGDYLLRLTVNGERIIAESNYDNNTVEVPVTIGVEDTPGGGGGGGGPSDCNTGAASEPCGWSLAPEFTGAACTPGEVLQLSCGCTCQGDPVLRVCDGSATCDASVALAFSDDTTACGLCSAAQFTCPESGVFSALRGSYPGSGPSSCELTLQDASGSGGTGGSAGSGGSAGTGGSAGMGGSASMDGGAGTGGHSHADIGFDTIHPILVSNCADCHSGGALPRLANADIEIAFKAARSRAVQIARLISSGAMPAVGCGGPPGSDGCVSAEDFELITQWVSAGGPR